MDVKVTEKDLEADDAYLRAKKAKALPKTIAQRLRQFRAKYNLTQVSAAGWFTLAPGTYRDYEQSRSRPPQIVERGILARIDDYEKEYAEYLRRYPYIPVSRTFPSRAISIRR